MTTIPHPSNALTVATPAGRELRQADKGIGNWLMDLVTGAGSSPAHIIITGVLGVVPGVGQAMDARDLILGIITISKTPAAIGGWVELVITLIGCVPAVGNALKVGFKLMKQGKGRDAHADRHVEIGSDQADEQAIRRGVNKPGVRKDGTSTGLATQMSHLWIVEGLEFEHLTPKFKELKKLIGKRERAVLMNPHLPMPYQRWIALVTGRQLSKHSKSGGRTHEVQTILTLPDNIRNQ